MVPSDDDTLDAFLGGRLRLRQARRGFRAGMDSIVLASALPPMASGRVLEIGAGAGAALLAAAILNPGWRCTGVERHAAEAARARTNAALNGLSDRVEVVEGDPIADPGLLTGSSFDAAFCNPPFNAQGRRPESARRHGHVSEYDLMGWVNAFANRLSGGAPLVMIHRAEALPALLDALQGRLGGVMVRPLQPFAHEPAHRVVVKATKGSRAAFRLLAPLSLHEEGVKHTVFAEALLRGEARLTWD
ncbi:MAG: methyltransferase [Alphaproteobacteria bacterium]|jgi:tRNA1(Val) A37 N6-methylase TrmN6|nr:methyltransferase [Alphaproteobacteria bacterium]